MFRKKATKASETVEEKKPKTHDPPQPFERGDEWRYVHRDNGDILTLNEEERGLTAEESEGVVWNKIVANYYQHNILSGRLASVEKLDTNAPVCSVEYEGVLVLIPAREMFDDDWPTHQEPPHEFKERLKGMLGATVEFKLRGVDLKHRIVAGSRKDALIERRSKYYETGRVVSGIQISCRVIRAAGNILTVEALGLDTMIPARDVSWQWFTDVADLYAPGDLVVAKVMDVGWDKETNMPTVRLSIKETTENPDIAALKRLIPGSVYFAVVTGVVDQLIFLRLQTGANAKTMSYRMDTMPSKNDTVCFQVKSVDLERGMAFGIITRTVKRFGRYR